MASRWRQSLVIGRLRMQGSFTFLFDQSPTRRLGKRNVIQIASSLMNAHVRYFGELFVTVWTVLNFWFCCSTRITTMKSTIPHIFDPHFRMRPPSSHCFHMLTHSAQRVTLQHTQRNVVSRLPDEPMSVKDPKFRWKPTRLLECKTWQLCKSNFCSICWILINLRLVWRFVTLFLVLGFSG